MIPLTLQLTYDVLTTEWATTEDLTTRLPMSTQGANAELHHLVSLGLAEQKLDGMRVLWRRHKKARTEALASGARPA